MSEDSAKRLSAAYEKLGDRCAAGSAAMGKFAVRWNDLRSDPSITADLEEWETEFP